MLAKLLEAKMVNYASKSQLGMSDDGLIQIISMGRGQFMPRWLGRLSADEIRDVAAFVRTLYKAE